MLVPGLLTGQIDEEARRHGIFIDSVEISLIDVEVVATADGKPVTDLTLNDFEILDDGEPVAITHFSRVEQGRRFYSADGRPNERPGEQSEETIEPPVREPTTVVVMVDQLFVSPISRRRVFDAVTRQLTPLLADGARVMVVNKTRDIAVEQDFSSNADLVQSAIDRLAEFASPGYASEVRSIAELWDIRPDAADSRQTAPGGPAPALATAEIDAQADYQDARALTQRMHADINASLVTLHRFLDSLAGLPGRKALLYVADHLPVRPGEQLWRIWWDKYGTDHGARLGVTSGGPIQFDLTLALESLISDANANRVAFYPIGSDAGADFSSASARGLASPTLAGSRNRQTVATDGLRWLAERTGGKAERLGGDFDGLITDMVRDLGTFYSLGYSSPHAADGEVHRLEIRVKRPGVELRHPTEYRDKSAEQRMTDRILAALTLGSEVNDLDARIDLGKPRKQGKGRYSVAIDIHVPMANLVLLPSTSTHQGKLSMQLIARDEEGLFSDPVVIRMPLEVPHKDMAWALSQTVDYSTTLTLGKGLSTVAVGVHDDLGQIGSTLAVAVDTGG
jgi:VWFA-related protein